MVRLFIAVPVPEDVREKIKNVVAEISRLRGLPEGIRFVPEENWHFTLVFLGYQPEESVPPVQNSIQAVSHSNVLKNIRIEFEKLTYGPVGRTPRMIWLTTTRGTSSALGRVKENLETELEKNGVRWRRESRPYQAHLTLARFLPQPAEDLPIIEERLDLSYSTGEVNLMKSTLRRTGAEYEVVP